MSEISREQVIREVAYQYNRLTGICDISYGTLATGIGEYLVPLVPMVSEIQTTIVTQTSEIENIYSTLSSLKEDIFYNEISDPDDRIYICNTYTSEEGYERINCIGDITTSGICMEFYIPLPKKLPQLPVGKKYVIKDLAIEARANGGYFGDYYAHGFQGWQYNLTATPMSDDVTIPSSVTRRMMRKYRLWYNIIDCQTAIHGVPSHHAEKDENQKIIRTPATAISVSIVDGKIEATNASQKLNSPGLLVINDGTLVSTMGWEGGNNNTSVFRSTYKVDTTFEGNQAIRIGLYMGPYDINIPIFCNLTSYSSVGMPLMNERCSFTQTENNTDIEFYKKWLPLPTGRADAVTEYTAWVWNTETWPTIADNNYPVEVSVNVLSLGIENE